MGAWPALFDDARPLAATGSPLATPQTQTPTPRIFAPQALSAFRSRLWPAALGLTTKNGFAVLRPAPAKPLEVPFGLKSTVLYASG